MADLGIKFVNADEGGLLLTINTHEGPIASKMLHIGLTFMVLVLLLSFLLIWILHLMKVS